MPVQNRSLDFVFISCLICISSNVLLHSWCVFLYRIRYISSKLFFQHLMMILINMIMVVTCDEENVKRDQKNRFPEEIVSSHRLHIRLQSILLQLLLAQWLQIYFWKSFVLKSFTFYASSNVGSLHCFFWSLTANDAVSFCRGSKMSTELFTLQ